MIRRIALLVVASVAASGCAQDDATPNETPPATVSKASATFTSQGSGDTNAERLDPLRSGQLAISTATGASRAVTGKALFGGDALTEVIWARPGIATWLAFDELGLVAYGDSVVGLYAEPRLLVPDSVRLGMAWESGGHVFEVTDRATADTAWGSVPTWTITEDAADAEVARPLVARYAEGHGVIAWGDEIFDAIIEPTVDIEARAPESVALKPWVQGGWHFTVTGDAADAWALDPDPGRWPLMVGMPRVIVPGTFTTSSGCALFAAGLAWERVPAIRDKDDDGYENLDCLPGLHASSAWLPPGMNAPVDWGPGGGRNVGATTFGGSEPRVDGFTEAPLPGEADEELLQLGPLATQMAPGGAEFSLASPVYAPDASAGGHPVAMLTGTGGLATTSLAPSGTPRGLGVGPWTGPWWSYRVTPSERHVLVTTPAGSVDRLWYDGLSWRREPLLDAALPEGALRVYAAFDLPDAAGRVLILTLHPGRDGGPPETRFWTADIPTVRPVRPWVDAMSVSMQQLDDRVVRVCLPPKPGGAPLEGWQLGDEAPLAVAPHFADERCVTLFGDRAFGSHVVVEAPLLSGGNVRLAAPTRQDSTWSRSAGPTLSAGGWVDASGTPAGSGLLFGTVHGGGGAQVGTFVFPAHHETTFPDIGGNGLWIAERNSGWYLAGATGTRRVFPEAFGLLFSTVSGYAAGGGLLWAGYLAPDGTHTALPDATNDLLAMARLVDGTVCGNTATEVRCVAPDNTVRTATSSPPTLPSGSTYDWWPLSDDTLVMALPSGGVWHLDPDAMSLVELDPAILTEPAWDPSGRLFARRGAGWVEVTANALVSMPQFDGRGLVPGANWFVGLEQSAPAVILPRWPADPAEGEDCGPSACTSWSACDYADACDQTGSRTRECAARTLIGGECVRATVVETDACSRATTGRTCGEPCTAWSKCIVENDCRVFGEESRVCTPRSCQAETCVVSGEEFVEARQCMRPEPAGTDCGPGTTCDGALCLETDCSDGADNDGDDLVDCEDRDDCLLKPCAPDKTCNFMNTCGF
ncbi:MAG: hypothetical protein H6744_14290 [Deltaproteobacteria bacterium]|nr:hypothetical protein [Deltaproteobacteria bacterium]MCB9787849.1 hypothetical protein [Deltaproteobacteria bacterium]